MKKYNFITKKLLIKEYSKKENSIAKIAKELRCSYRTIRDRLIKYNIRIRTRSEARKGKYEGKNNNNYIDGRKNKKYYCIESNCSNEITYMNWLYGNRRCHFCAAKVRWEDEEYRENQIQKLRNRYKIIDKLVYAINVMLTRRLALDVPGDEKYMFEKDIINLLKKYNLYSKKVSAVQNVKIVVDVNKIPKVDIGYLIIDRLEIKEK